MEYAIRLKGLTKSFQKEKVLKNITHDFEKGKIHGIMGFNGSGKTVMFKCICGFLQPESGTPGRQADSRVLPRCWRTRPSSSI